MALSESELLSKGVRVAPITYQGRVVVGKKRKRKRRKGRRKR
jgi:hypothetical protein